MKILLLKDKQPFTLNGHIINNLFHISFQTLPKRELINTELYSYLWYSSRFHKIW